MKYSELDYGMRVSVKNKRQPENNNLSEAGLLECERNDWTGTVEAFGDSFVYGRFVQVNVGKVKLCIYNPEDELIPAGETL